MPQKVWYGENPESHGVRQRSWRGKAEGKAESILVLLSAKGTVPPKVKEAVYAQTDMDALNQWLLLAAGNVEEFIDGMHFGTGRYQKTVE
nr:hypothetical protein [uncultured Acetatifactor sp.]